MPPRELERVLGRNIGRESLGVARYEAAIRLIEQRARANEPAASRTKPQPTVKQSRKAL